MRFLCINKKVPEHDLVLVIFVPRIMMLAKCIKSPESRKRLSARAEETDAACGEGLNLLINLFINWPWAVLKKDFWGKLLIMVTFMTSMKYCYLRKMVLLLALEQQG